MRLQPTHRKNCATQERPNAILIHINCTVPDTACPYPVEPPEDSHLEVLDWDGGIIAIGRTLSFGCKNGKRFEADPEQRSVEATCVGGSDWTEPDEWGRCVESKEAANGRKLQGKSNISVVIVDRK